MTSHRFESLIRRRTDEWHRRLAAEIGRLRDDTGLSQRALSEAAGVDSGYMSRIEQGRVRPTVETYLRIATSLGADFSAHLYPNTGPTIRDRHQAPILEALIEFLHPRWQPFPQVAVRRPSRGWVDVVLHDARADLLVATEIVSEVRRIEQLIRWSKEKADSLPSWNQWPRFEATTGISQLVIVRRTRTNLTVAREFDGQLRLGWPVHPADALESLTGTAPWPGPTLFWAETGGPGVRFLATRA
jgi:transcriptional regulator with XRE-family HTH domain